MLLALLLLASPDPLRAALVEGKVIDAASRAAARAMKDSSMLRCAAALQDAIGNYQAGTELRKKAPPEPPPKPPEMPKELPKPGARVYVLASRLTLRSKAEPGAKAVVSLPIATPVEVLATQGPYAKVRAPFRAGPSRIVDMAGDKKWKLTPEPAEGWVAAAFLGANKPDAAALQDQGDLSALERLAALDPTNRGVLSKLAGLAYDAGNCGLAGWASAVLAGTAAPLAGWDVELIQPLYGCRGDLSKALLFAPKRQDVFAGKAPADACATEPPPEPPCPFCSLEGEEEPPEAKEAKAKAIEAANEYSGKWGKLYAGPRLRLHLRRRAGPTSPVFAFTATYNPSCEFEEEPMYEGGVGISPVSLPADARPGELVELYVPASGITGLIAAADADAARAAAIEYRHSAAVRAMALRAYRFSMGRDCCCD